MIKPFDPNRRKETEDKWEKITSSMFPIAMKVAAQTIGLDLVSVKPMSAPLNILPYFQYGNTKRTTRKRKINNIFKFNE